jgi:hypothetical protein
VAKALPGCEITERYIEAADNCLFFTVSSEFTVFSQAVRGFHHGLLAVTQRAGRAFTSGRRAMSVRIRTGVTWGQRRSNIQTLSWS